MKNIILIMIVFAIKVNAQITLEHTYDSAGYNNGNNWQQLYVVKLEVDGDKIVFADKANKLIKLYNLNHTLWKTVSFANATDLNSTYNKQNIMYISQHLFDTDDEIEFLYIDNDAAAQTLFITQVINEDGNLIFTANGQAPRLIASAPQEQLPIYNTSSGTKMILSGGFNDSKAYVYSLIGTLSTGIVAAPNSELNQLRTSFPYPNPTNSTTKIDYTLPNGVNTGEIIFYDTQGKEVKRFDVDNTFNSLEISTEDLQSGIYYYNLQTAQGNSEAKKLITIK